MKEDWTQNGQNLLLFMIGISFFGSGIIIAGKRVSIGH